MLPITFNLRAPGTILLMVGISLSIAILTAMLSIGEARQRKVRQALHLPPEGEDIVEIVRLRGEVLSREWIISQEQVEAVRNLPSVLGVSAFGVRQVSFKYGNKNEKRRLMGIDEQFFYATSFARYKTNLLEGRELNSLDLKNRARVCILKREYKDYFGLRDLPDTVRIDGYPFEVIGLSESQLQVWIPVTTFTDIYGDNLYLGLRINTGASPEETQADLNKRLQAIFATNDEFEYGYSRREEVNKLYDMARRQVVAMGLVGLIPLAISFFGALGISASWLKERTRLFAILRVCGATRQQVAMVAVAEPLFIAAVAGLIGLGLGFLLSVAVQHWIGLDVAYNWRWFALSWAAGLAAMLGPSLYISLRAATAHPAKAIRL